MRVIVLTGSSTDQNVQEAILAGARGYLMKEIDPKALAQAVVDVADGKTVFDHDSAARAMRLVRAQAAPTVGESLATLSLQERRVLALVAQGRTNKEIGAELALSENTVKNYLSNVFEKLQVKHRSQAASIYVQANPPKV
jgi:DNA-binding NarL/FixJ family response regulator